jgi:hypothetical protein
MLDADKLMLKFGGILIVMWAIIGGHLAFDEQLTQQSFMLNIQPMGWSLPLLPTLAAVFIGVAMIGGVIIEGLKVSRIVN